VESSSDNSPLIAVVGPTASGKTGLAIALAEKHDGEIVSADSRTIYKGMDIGTAKPSAADRRRVPHHLLDILTPDEAFTVANYKSLAQGCIAEIAGRGKLPILVGGSGLYIDAVLFNFAFRGSADPGLRSQLQPLSVEELQQLLKERSISLPENKSNRRHLVRRLETGDTAHQSEVLRPNTLIIGLEVDREILTQRVANRLEVMFTAGLAAEVASLAGLYGWSCKALQTIGYREFESYTKGAQKFDELKEHILRDTIAYAKRQRTWLGRNKSIHWIREQAEAEDLMTTFLSK
jgi:tRNA dimethylallyltransferase